jgi:putative hydrolase of the HAD superfamily
MKLSKVVKIKNIIWDVDGTLYQSTTKLNNEIYEIYVDYLAEHKPLLTREEVKDLFAKTYKKIGTSTASMAYLTKKPIKIPGAYIEKHTTKIDLLNKDTELIKVFNQLVNDFNINNYICRNGTTNNTVLILKKLGLGLVKAKNCEFGPFVKVVGVFDQLNTTKPNPEVYEYFINKLGLNPNNTLAIGDRPGVDLLPAKKLGMKTALVWQSKIPQEAVSYVDYSLPTVYELTTLLNNLLKN